MANRDALREFQSRLASRLQEARAAGGAASWLAVYAQGAGYLFPLNHAGEIFPWSAPQRVPHAQPWFAGVVNLRGGISGIVDLGAFISGGESAPRNELQQAQSRLVSLNEALGVNCALLVDRLAGLRGVESFVESSAPPADAPPYFGHRYTDEQGTSWQEINLQSLALFPAFLSISA